MRFITIIILALLLEGCSRPSLPTHRFWNEWGADPKKYGDTFDWNGQSPVQFLDLLKQSGDIYAVLGLHHDWIRESDVEALMSRLDSSTPCAFVVSTASSHYPNGRSTEGREAAYLLEGYRCHYYPPQLSSANFEPNRAELRQWYRVWSTRK